MIADDYHVDIYNPIFSLLLKIMITHSFQSIQMLYNLFNIQMMMMII